MPYRAPLRDQMFVLRDVLGLEAYAGLPAFADASVDVVEQILGEAAKFAEGVLEPLNHSGDREGCVWSPQGVKTPTGFADAYRQMVDAGWLSLGGSQDYGGQGLPSVVQTAFAETVSSANMAFGMYFGLAHGAYSAILAGGTDEQKSLYLPRLVSGEWGGTMNLTEPQCGTDLGLIRTKATPQADGTYKISGQKIWISGGEQDLTDNIVHLVLARIEGAPAGTKGISLFIVPKFIPNADATLGARNSLSCAGLEEKMGIHGNATCVMAYDEATRQKSADYMALMTPVVKAILTDRGFKSCSEAMQVHGGSGFTEHFPVSQYLRDCRITMIFEGTNGIQAMDLVGRKLGKDGGRGVMAFFAEIDAFVAEGEGGSDALKLQVEGLKSVKAQLQEATLWLMQHGLANPENAGAGAHDYLQLFGLTALAYMWAMMVKAAEARIDAGETDPFYADKRMIGRYFVERLLPDAPAHLAKLKTGSATVMALEAGAF